MLKRTVDAILLMLNIIRDLRDTRKDTGVPREGLGGFNPPIEIFQIFGMVC